MSDKQPGVLESLGMVSGLAAAGYLVKEMAGARTNIKEGTELFKQARETSKIKAAQKIAQKNMTKSILPWSELGLDKLPNMLKGAPVATTVSNAKDVGRELARVFGNGGLSEHMQFLNELIEISKTLTSHNRQHTFKVLQHIGNNASVQLIMNHAGGDLSINFGMISKGGRYARTNYGLTYGVAPKFLDPMTYQKLMANQIKTADELYSGILDINTFIARGVHEELKQNGVGNSLRRAVDMAALAEQNVVTVRVPNVSNPAFQREAARVIPYQPTEEGLKLLTPALDYTTVQQMWQNIENLEGIDLGKLLFARSENEKAFGVFNDPHSSFIHSMSNTSLESNKAMRQAIGKETMIGGDLAAAGRYGQLEIAGGMGNIASILTYTDTGDYWRSLGMDETLIDQVLESGFGLEKGVGFGLKGREGAIITEGLAKSDMIDIVTHNVDLTEALDRDRVAKFVEDITAQYIDKIAIQNTDNQNVIEYTKSLMSKKHSTVINANKVARQQKKYSAIKDVLTDTEVNQLAELFGVKGDRRSVLSAMKFKNIRRALNTWKRTKDVESINKFNSIASNIFSKITKFDTGHKTIISSVLGSIGGLHRKGVLTNTETGSIRFGEYGQETISDIISGGDVPGFRIVGRAKNKLGDYFKTWFAKKQTAAQIISNSDAERLMRNTFGLQRFIQTSSNPARAARLVSERLKRGHFSKLQKIVDSFGDEYNSLNLDTSKMIFASEGYRSNSLGVVSSVLEETLIKDFGQSPEELAKLSPTEILDFAKQLYEKNRGNAKYDVMLGSIIDENNPVYMPGIGHNPYSIGEAGSLAGLKMNKNVNFSPEMAEKYAQLGMPSISDAIIKNINMEEYQQIYDAYAPLSNPSLIKDALVINQDDILADRELFNVMFNSDDPRKVRNAFVQAAKQLGIKAADNVSDKTRLLIKLSNDATIPILDFTSNSYVGIVNPISGEETGTQLIRKQLSTLTKRVITANPGDEFNAAYDELVTGVGKILFDKNIFTKQPMKGAILEARPGLIFNTSSLEAIETNAKRMNKMGALANVMNKYGITATEQGIDFEAFRGRSLGIMSDADFFDFIGGSDFYQNKLRAAGLNPKTSGNKLKSFQRSLLSELHNANKQYAFGGRHPVGYGAWQIIAGESLLRDVYTDVYGLGLKEAENLSQNIIRKGGLYLSEYLETLLTADYDRDQIVMALANQQMGKEIESALTNEEFIKNVSGKGIKVKKASHGSIAELMEKLSPSEVARAHIDTLNESIAFSAGVGPISNKLRNLRRSYGDDIDRKISYMIDVLRESSIGSKGFVGKSVENLETFKSIFDRGMDVDTRASTLKSIVLHGDETNNALYNIFKDVNDDFYKDIIKNYDEFMGSPEGKIASLQNTIRYTDKFTDKELKYWTEFAQSMSVKRNIDAEIGSLVDVANQSASKLSKARNIAAEVGETGFTKAIKSKPFLLLAGGAITLAMLKPADNSIKHQDIRSESKIKKAPTAAEPIDPQTGMVYKPQPQAYNFQVRGKTPRNTSIEQIRNDINGFGIPFGGTVVNRSPGADASYVRQLQETNDSLMWNNV